MGGQSFTRTDLTLPSAAEVLETYHRRLPQQGLYNLDILCTKRGTTELVTTYQQGKDLAWMDYAFKNGYDRDGILLISEPVRCSTTSGENRSVMGVLFFHVTKRYVLWKVKGTKADLEKFHTYVDLAFASRRTDGPPVSSKNLPSGHTIEQLKENLIKINKTLAKPCNTKQIQVQITGGLE